MGQLQLTQNQGSTEQVFGPYDSMVHMVRHWAKHSPNKPAYIWLKNGDKEESRLTFSEVDQRAQSIAAQLQARNLEGKTALMLYPPGLDFLCAFLACLYAGVISIPVNVPRQREHLDKLITVVADSSAEIVLSSSLLKGNLKERFMQSAELNCIEWLYSDTIDAASASQWKEANINKDTVAFLQYTSGSTGKPKGVVVTHGNLLHNENMLMHAFAQTTEHSLNVTWLPLFHDMGLIGNVLQSLYVGITCVLMAPVAFLQRPIRWLRAISQYRATSSGGPNFAYDLCVERIKPEEYAGLDLSCWEIAFNGAEPVRASTLQVFSETFSSVGFRSAAFYPCYGMAEATLIITGGTCLQEPTIIHLDRTAFENNKILLSNTHDTVQLVSSGRIMQDQTIAIVDPDSLQPCVEGLVGEIWVSGGSVCPGYYRRPDTTKETYGFTLDGVANKTFVRSGDHGFLHNGELFVTGRIKDLIIIRGQNHYPQDIELTVENCHPGLRNNAGAAFGIDICGEENLIIVQEVERTHLKSIDVEQVTEDIREAVAEQHALRVHDVEFIMPNSIAKTSSGKIQRKINCALYQSGQLKRIKPNSLVEVA